jgi:hypothetical protein
MFLPSPKSILSTNNCGIINLIYKLNMGSSCVVVVVCVVNA